MHGNSNIKLKVPGFFPGDKTTADYVNDSFLTSSKFKKEWRYISTLLYALMAFKG